MSTYALTILVVEDNEEMRAFLRRQLAERYRVLVAADGEEGWARVQGESPDLIVSDTKMPGMTGQALCRRVKETNEVPSIPVILLVEESSRVGKRTSAEVDVPADEELSKPFDMSDLHDRVERYLPARELPPFPSVDEPGEFLKEVLRTIERWLHDPGFSVGDLAETVALSRRHLTRRLKAVAGVTPAALIRARRIARAKAQLEKDPDSIAEVGQAVGFRSASHFSQVFRGHVGCSPSTYLERHVSSE